MEIAPWSSTSEDLGSGSQAQLHEHDHAYNCEVFPKLLRFHHCLSFEFWPCGVALTVCTVHSTEGRSEPEAHPSAKTHCSVLKDTRIFLNGHFWKFGNFSIHRCDRRKTFLFVLGKWVYLCPCKVSHKCSSCLLLLESLRLWLHLLREYGTY